MQKRKPRAQQGKSRRLSEKDWIAEAMQLLINKGIEAVRVEVLAKRLGVTKGSFYWHFSDRADLLRAILATWQQRETRATIERLEKAISSPADRIRELLGLPTRAKGATTTVSTELAIRAWAWRDHLAHGAVDDVDRQRLQYNTQLFVQMGFSAQEAEAWAFLTYSYNLAEILLRNQGTVQSKSYRRQFFESLILAGPVPHARRARA